MSSPTISHVEALTLAHTEFAQRLARVGPEHWDLPTPCEAWDVRELVRHVIACYDLYLKRLDGLPSSDIAGVLSAYPMPDDHEGEFFRLGDEFEERYGQPATLKIEVDHFGGQRITGEYLLALRIFDMVIHSWDLARSLHLDETLNPKLVDLLWREWSPQADKIAAFGVLGDGPSDTLASDASVQDRLLDLLGRRP